METSQKNIDELNTNGDIIFIHDPQPIGLIEKKNSIGKKWAWRCHIDFTNPQKDVIDFLDDFIEQYL